MNDKCKSVPCVAPQTNVGLEIGNDACLTVEGLLRYGLEEEVHGLAETLLRSGSRSDNHASPEAVGSSKKRVTYIAHRVGGTHSLVIFPTRVTGRYCPGSQSVFMMSTPVLDVPRWFMSSEMLSRWKSQFMKSQQTRSWGNAALG